MGTAYLNQNQALNVYKALYYVRNCSVLLAGTSICSQPDSNRVFG